MSDAGIFITESFLEEAEADTNSSDARAERRYKLIIAAFFILCALFLSEFVGYKVVKPSLTCPKITVTGQKSLTAEEICTTLLPMSSSTWFSFDVNRAASLICSIPSIENAIVEKHFPNRVVINVSERIPVAITYVEENGKSVPFQIDENGIMFTSRNSKGLSSMPIISGIPVEHVSNGMRLPVKYRSLIEQISNIQNLPQKYFAAVSEICVVPKEYGNYELVLIPSSAHVKVLTDRSLNEDALKYMMVVLDVVKQLETDVSEVDLRYGSVSYRS